MKRGRKREVRLKDSYCGDILQTLLLVYFLCTVQCTQYGTLEMTANSVHFVQLLVFA